jgi:hypothetical protein
LSLVPRAETLERAAKFALLRHHRAHDSFQQRPRRREVETHALFAVRPKWWTIAHGHVRSIEKEPSRIVVAESAAVDGTESGGRPVSSTISKNGA